MERLTNRNYGEISHTGKIIPYSTHCIGCITSDCDCGITEDMVKKLANYEDLEEQGQTNFIALQSGRYSIRNINVKNYYPYSK